MRTWRIEIAKNRASWANWWPPWPRVAMAQQIIHATDEADAEQQTIALLGLALVPCCGDDPDAPPCAECAAQLAGDAVDRLMDLEQDRRAGL
jgi:hypothetical protein